ncbi:MAG TPA: hypothetical protein VHY35_06295 [Stellaceae bacterium]|jgi:ppGpp synthetase/RelA/SpoT-type nucleotidyltranferase|nr:hypothetical protein [Stellaceae bacterium]
MKNSKSDFSALEIAYRQRYLTVLKHLELPLQEHVAQYLVEQPRIDRITARAKGIDSFLAKSKNKSKSKLKYSHPLDQIQDQLGVRIITFYLSDVERLDAIVRRYFTPIEYKSRVPDSQWEFGYFGRHYVLVLPTDIIDEDMSPDMLPGFFELQIKTLFQHAWSESEHDLGYKPREAPLTDDQKRRLAFTSAQAWGADRIFNELFDERHSEQSTSNDNTMPAE